MDYKEKYEQALSVIVKDCERELKDLGIAIGANNNRTDVVERVQSINDDDEKAIKDPPKNDYDSHFANEYVDNSQNKEKLMKYLHLHIKGKTKQNALVYIQGAIAAGLLLKPSYPDLIEEFGQICSDSGYSDMVTDSGYGIFKHRQGTVMRISEELEEMFKQLAP